MSYRQSVVLGDRDISITSPAYFIADIAANHDGDLGRAKDLIWKAKDAGADAAKFQHFLAKDIVSDRGFRSLGGQMAHQAKWTLSVYEVYEKYQLNRDWDAALAETAKAAGIAFMTTPYDVAAVDAVEALVPAFKIGSGDITWPDFLSTVAGRGKPVLLATGAATMEDVERAVDAVLACNPQLVLMQCNTNYTGNLENFRHVNLNVLKAFAIHWPGMPLGLSDHTPGAATVVGAVALGARVIEKHFTDDNTRDGPDHAFSMTPATWREMVERTRELEAALGDGVKRIEANERQSAVVQRRCLRLTGPREAGHIVVADDLEALRPAPAEGIAPYHLPELLGRRLAKAKAAGEELRWADLEDAP